MKLQGEGTNVQHTLLRRLARLWFWWEQALCLCIPPGEEGAEVS